jgi:hypothetical protein
MKELITNIAVYLAKVSDWYYATRHGPEGSELHSTPVYVRVFEMFLKGRISYERN